MTKLKFLFFILLFNSHIGLSTKDSLYTAWGNTELHDTLRIAAFQSYIVQHFLYNNPDSAFKLANEYYLFAEERGLTRKMSTAMNIQGIARYFVGDYDESIKYYTRCLEYRESVGDESGVASVLNNIGNVYFDQADYAVALDYFFKSLKIEEKLGNEDGIGSSLNNIGLIYKEQGDFEEALSYYFKSLMLQSKAGNAMGESHALNNIGVIYLNQLKHDEALLYFNKSLKVNAGLENGTTALIKYNIGDILLDKKEYKKAIASFNEALKIQKEIGDIQGESATLNRIGWVKFSQNEQLEAIYYSEKALLLAKEFEGKNEIKKAAKNLYEFYLARQQSKQALEMFTLYIDTKNEIDNEKTSKELIRQSIAYDYEKKAIKDSLENRLLIELNETKLVSEREKKELAEHKNYYLYGGLLIALIMGGFVLSKYQVISKQKVIIERKSKEILYSIQYAKRIQMAILPSSKLITTYFKECFILYMPKDIVAGDFYWMKQRGDNLLFAVADCTGHGVPGAMVSVICNNGLNRAIREYGLLDPGEVLDKTREIVISEFEKSDKNVRDGMDIGFCTLNGNTLRYAGAHIPLWIIRNDELLEFKADKQPIGEYPKKSPYVTRTIQLQQGDMVYLASDGYSDQFGGVRNKKLKTKAFKKLLLDMRNRPMTKQQEMLGYAFNNWKGENEQLDDVCVLGFKYENPSV